MTKRSKTKTSTTKRKATKTPRPPKGFKPLKATPNAAENAITERLESLREKIDAGRVRVHRYGDDSIDGEFTMSVPRGTSTEELLGELRDAFGTGPGGLGTGYWLQIGERYVIKEDDEVYRRFKGMNELSMFYTRVRTSNIISAFGAARTKMTRGAEKKYHRKAESVFVRIHWNPKNDKPRR